MAPMLRHAFVVASVALAALAATAEASRRPAILRGVPKQLVRRAERAVGVYLVEAVPIRTGAPRLGATPRGASSVAVTGFTATGTRTGTRSTVIAPSGRVAATVEEVPFVGPGGTLRVTRETTYRDEQRSGKLVRKQAIVTVTLERADGPTELSRTTIPYDRKGKRRR